MNKQTANPATTLSTGLFALLSSLLRTSGTGASKISRGSGAPLRRLILSALVTTLGALAFTAAPAGAIIVHEHLTDLTGFSNVQLVAFSPGKIYALDAGTVDRVDTSGAPLNFTASKTYIEGSRLTGTPTGPFGKADGLAVNNSTGEIYVADGQSKVVDVFSSSGEYISQLAGTPSSAPLSGPFAEPSGLAFDQVTKELYVTDNNNGLIDVFSSSGEYVSQFGGGMVALHSVTKVAVNEFTGNVYAVNSEESSRHAEDVVIFSSLGSSVLIEWFGNNSPHGFNGTGYADAAVDQLTGHVYVANLSKEGAPYASSGEEFGSSTTEEYLGAVPSGFAASVTDPASGDVYVPAGSVVEVYTPDLVAAEVSTGAASSVTRSTVTLEGVVEPGEFAVNSCEFEYRTTAEPNYTHTVACAQSTPLTGSKPIAVSANLTGLMGATVYDYRVAATNANATNRGSERSFTTAPAVDALNTGAVEAVGKTTATLTGALSPDGADTHYYFEYGVNPYESLSPALPGTDAGSASESVRAETALSGLAPSTSYNYRLVGVDSFGTTQGQNVSFTTLPAVDALSTGPAENVSETAAKLAGALSPDGLDAHYYFEYGTSASYGSVSPELPGTDAGSASVQVHAEAALSGLTPTTTYHYRLVGVNSAGTTYGADATFSTPGPPVIPFEIAENVGSGKATLQTQIDPGGAATTYQFEYGETESYGTSVPSPAGSIVAGNVPVAPPVALVTGLKASTTYHFRVRASNEHGTVDGPDQTFTTLPAAYVESEFATGLTASSATLHAQVNPLGTDTTVDFQYGTVSCTASPASCVSGGSDIGSAESAQAVSFNAQNLVPGTRYYYRVAAVNELGTIYGADRTFTTQPAATKAAALPDGRRYELVSPRQKDGAEILGMGGGGETAALGDATQASVNGTSVTYIANAPVGSHQTGNSWSTQILSKREAGGWSSEDIEVPHPHPLEFNGGLFDEGEEYKLFSADLSRAVFQSPHFAREPSLAPEVHGEVRGPEEIYLRDDATGAFRALLTTEPLRSPVQWVGASPDLSHVVFEGPSGLDPKYPFNGGLYEWAGGRVQLVSVLPTGEPVSGATLAGEGGAERGAVSNDGRVVWQVANHLYSSDVATGETVQVDLPQGGSGENEHALRLQMASSDGSRIFFIALAQLTADPFGSNLYMFNVSDGKLTDLTPVEGARVSLAMGSAEDGTALYVLTGGGVLTSEPNSEGQHAEEVTNNIFVLQETPVGSGAWSTKFIASISETDALTYQSPKGSAFQVSPNGRYFAFMSNASLTGYDNHDAISGAEDEEVYLYGAEANQLVCASCNPTGARPVGEFETGEFPGTPVDPWKVWAGQTLAAAVPGWTPHTRYQPRFLSNAGRLFFDSVDPLVPQDVNGKPDVYEYEPDGVGSCGYSPGCVALISAGTGGGYSTFFDASASGNDVFFTTQDGLVAQDKDGTSDMYDARVCTAAEPCPSSIATSPPCTTADSCRAASLPQPGVFGASGSATFAGAGNPVPAPTTVVKAKTRAQTRAEKLAKALNACNSKPRSKRRSCRARARKRYGKAKTTGRRIK